MLTFSERMLRNGILRHCEANDEGVNDVWPIQAAEDPIPTFNFPDSRRSTTKLSVTLGLSTAKQFLDAVSFVLP